MLVRAVGPEAAVTVRVSAVLSRRRTLLWSNGMRSYRYANGRTTCMNAFGDVWETEPCRSGVPWCGHL